MKCNGDFVCTKCRTMTHEVFDVETEEEATHLSITCPNCGKENVQLIIPTIMKETIEILLSKGYHVFNINSSTLSIIFDNKDLVNVETSPSEFIVDTTDKRFDVIFNERMRVRDYEGFDENVYRTVAYRNLLNWAKDLKTIKED